MLYDSFYFFVLTFIDSCLKEKKFLKKVCSKVCVFLCLGLRSALGAGFSRMNDLTVIQATQVNALLSTTFFFDIDFYWLRSLFNEFIVNFESFISTNNWVFFNRVLMLICFSLKGFCKYLISQFDDVKTSGVVIGHDARHGSHRSVNVFL